MRFDCAAAVYGLAAGHPLRDSQKTLEAFERWRLAGEWGDDRPSAAGNNDRWKGVKMKA